MIDLAVESVFPGAQLAWYAQYEPPDKDGKIDRHQYAARIMAHHWPGVPNHGDITAIDYAGVEPVDLLTAGFPCTDLSLAGKRAGLMPGTRSGVWSHVARAIGALRPSLVLIENVRSLTSAKAHCDVESCPRCMGDPGDGDTPVPYLRALGCVLGDLADLGFDAEWTCLPASGVGAPHRRERVFVLAWPAADAANLGHERRGLTWGRRPGPSHGGVAASDAQGVGRGEGRPEPARLVGGPDAAERRSAPAADAERLGSQGQRSDAGPHEGQTSADVCGRGPTGGRSAPTDPEGERHGHAGATGLGGLPAAALAGAPADPDGGRRAAGEPDDAQGQPDARWRTTADPDDAALGAQRDREPQGPEADHGRHRLDPSGRFLGWGPYEPAIRRWEHILGRPAPSPVDDRGRLNPPLPEWMMGLPDGWVTAVPGIPRNPQLHALGNGCVVQQAAHALRLLLPAYLAACQPADGFGVIRNGIRQQATTGAACGDPGRAA
jgi:DNA (cytosine-5)-methyltransferase 1